MPVEHLDQFGEVHQRAAQAVDLVDHHHVDPSRLDVREQPLQRRPLQRAAGEAAVVVAVLDQHPAFGPLAGHVGLARVPLGIEGVVFAVGLLVGADARVNRATALGIASDGAGWPPEFTPPPHEVAPAAQAEEGPAIPSGAGDGAGDRARATGRADPRYSKPSASTVTMCSTPFVLPDKLRAGNRPVISADPAQGDVAAVELLAQRLQPGHRLGLQAAVGQFLDR